MKRLIQYSVILWALLVVPAWAMTLADAKVQLPQAKAQGLIGERGDGYLGVVQQTPAMAELVKVINKARRSAYTRMAAGNNIDLSVVEQRAGAKALQKTPSGQMILQSGQWVRKP